MAITEVGLKLRTSLSNCKSLKSTTTAAGTHSSGDIVKVGAVMGFVVSDVATSSDFVLIYEAEKVIGAISGEVVSTGDQLYWGTASAAITTSTGGGSGTKAGIALESAGTTDTGLEFDLQVML